MMNNVKPALKELVEAASACVDLAANWGALGSKTFGEAKIAAGDIDRLMAAIRDAKVALEEL
jgi:hypothetical protein